MTKNEVVIVGAGLAGLACAIELQRAGRSVRLLEGATRPGGRVRTDEVDGFLLDRGFQVLLPSYPEARRQLDLDMLEPAAFRPGAVVRAKGRFHKLADPTRALGDSLAGVWSGIGTLRDKLRVLGFGNRLQRDLVGGWTGTAQAAIEREGFSRGFRERFLRPFLGGVFLDADLTADAHLLSFYWSMFRTSLASLPKRGMGSIPEQLAERLAPGTLSLKARVRSVEADGVTLADGSRVEATEIVLATDGSTAADLVFGADWAPAWNGVTTLSFAAERAPFEGPWLLLNGEEQGFVNDVVVYSEVQPSYAPPNRALISVSVLGVPELDDAALGERVRAELSGWFGDRVARWEPLRTLRIERALPRATTSSRVPRRTAGGAWLAGDHTESPSIHGALLSGRRTSEDIEARAAQH
ncbi:MAG: NAD(P)/FAD-dependent oxidoreductase [Planctomycetota bacterium]